VTSVLERPAAAGGHPRRRPVAPAVGVALAAAVVGVVLSLCLGTRGIAPADVWAALFAPGAGDDAVVVRDLRLPRTLLGLAVGAALGVAGTLAQGHTRNPVADPGLLGVSAGAAFAVVLGVHLTGASGTLAYVWFAFPGALVAGVLVFALGATGRGGATPVTLALAGAGLTALLGALTTTVVLLDPEGLDAFRYWSVGSLSGRGEAVGPLAPFFAAGLVLALLNARALNALGLGADTARALGVDPLRARCVGLAALVLLTGAAVAAAGPIAFLGLVVPHAGRALAGPDHRVLLPVSALLGGGVLLLADVVGRLAAPPGELQVGIVLAGLGAPVFIALVRRRRMVLA
jgi:iron complex transport system permease protein